MRLGSASPETPPWYRDRRILAWALFDASLAPFSVLVVTIGYSTYFKEVVAGGAREGDFLWGLAASLSMLVVAVLAPVLGAHADRSGTKLPFLVGATTVMVVGTALLSTVGPGMVVRGMLLFVIANVGFQGGQVFYNAYLPEIAPPRSLGTVSGFSFALGYAGALVCLAAALPYYRHTTAGGDLSPAQGLFAVAALGAALVAAPSLLVLGTSHRTVRTKRAGARQRSGLRQAWHESAGRLGGTFRDLRRHRDAFRFLLAYLVYMDAITTMVAFTAIYARQTIGLSISTIVTLFLVSQLTAMPGSLLLGRVADRIGPKTTTSLILLLWVGILVLALAARGFGMFLAVALLAGVGTGSLQAVSRSMMSQLAPQGPAGGVLRLLRGGGPGLGDDRPAALRRRLLTDGQPAAGHRGSAGHDRGGTAAAPTGGRRRPSGRSVACTAPRHGGIAMAGRIRVGTCSWSEKTMIQTWYPGRVTTAAERLAYYARHFDTVELDSSFYGIPSDRNARLWAERTPPGFTFHVKAFAMMTRHAVRPNQLPPSLRHAFPYELDRTGRILHPSADFRAEVFQAFTQSLEPMRAAGRLGLILLQFPPYFVADEENRRYIRTAASLVAPDPVAVEFRHSSWVEPDELERTLRFLSDHDLAYVSVDEPRLEGKTVLPPLVAATADAAYVRMHGRNEETWHKRVSSAAERFKYLYPEEELREWVDPVRHLAEEAQTTYVMFNNCYADYAPRNARQMQGLLGLPQGPAPAVRRRTGRRAGQPPGRLSLGRVALGGLGRRSEPHRHIPMAPPMMCHMPIIPMSSWSMMWQWNMAMPS